MAVDQAGRVWDLRGITRVGAHAASGSNPDANHEWVGVLFILGDREPLTAAMVRAFQDFRHDVFLPRWPGRTRLTGHGRAPGVPGAQTSCPGPSVAAKITDGTLAQPPGTPTEDDMTPEQATQLERTWQIVTDIANWVHPVDDAGSPIPVKTALTRLLAAPVDVAALAAAIVAALPPGQPVDLATVEQGVRNVLLNGV